MDSPKAKRQKIDNEPSNKLRAILPDEYVKDIPLGEVYISRLESKKGIFGMMQELGINFPLAEKFQHLKRVRNNEVLLGVLVNEVNEADLEEFLEKKCISPGVIEMLTHDIRRLKVPVAPPKLRWQYEVCQQYWSCKFHPQQYWEELYSGENFNPEARRFHVRVAQLAAMLSKAVEHKPFGICVDPRTQHIVALASSRTEISPHMHCPMVLIDFVARTQNPSDWEQSYPDEMLEAVLSEGRDARTLAGIPTAYYKRIKSFDSEAGELKFGAERPQHQKGAVRATTSCDGDNLTKFGPYLCTGYDVYLSHEPCLMCAMALVHSRARRVFFVKRSKENGALVSCFKLQAVKELNHHYEVYECGDEMIDRTSASKVNENT